jgi:hypothetical protein
MTLKKAFVLLIGATALAAPAAALAQQYYREQPSDSGSQYNQPYYSQPNGDYQRRSRRYGFAGYPEFRGVESHIRQEIYEGARDDMIQSDDARDLRSQLHDIQMEEAREFGVHGWNLPEDDRAQIDDRLRQLDQLVDQTRDEQ